MRFDLPAILLSCLDLASAGSDTLSYDSSGSNDEFSSISSGSSMRCGFSTGAESSDEQDDLSKNRIRRSVLKKIKHLTGDTGFDKRPDHIHALQNSLTILLKRSKLYRSSEIDKILAMSPKTLKKDIIERYESNVHVLNIDNYRRKIKEYVGKKKTLKSEIEEKREKYKARTRKSGRVRELCDNSNLKTLLGKVRRKIRLYSNRCQIYEDTKKCYEAVSRLPLEKIVGKNSISVLYGAYIRSLGERGRRCSASGKKTIRALEQKWVLLECAFRTRRHRVLRSKVVSVCRDYGRASFEERIAMGPGSCSNAYALLCSQDKFQTKYARLRSQTKPSKRHKYNRNPHCLYGYETRGADRKPQTEKLLIPRYVKGGASTHRLAIINLLKFREKDSSTTRYYLQLSYEDVPSQCRCSPFFNASAVKVVAERERL